MQLPKWVVALGAGGLILGYVLEGDGTVQRTTDYLFSRSPAYSRQFAGAPPLHRTLSREEAQQYNTHLPPQMKVVNGIAGDFTGDGREDAVLQVTLERTGCVTNFTHIYAALVREGNTFRTVPLDKCGYGYEWSEPSLRSVTTDNVPEIVIENMRQGVKTVGVYSWTSNGMRQLLHIDYNKDFPPEFAGGDHRFSGNGEVVVWGKRGNVKQGDYNGRTLDSWSGAPGLGVYRFFSSTGSFLKDMDAGSRITHTANQLASVTTNRALSRNERERKIRELVGADPQAAAIAAAMQAYEGGRQAESFPTSTGDLALFFLRQVAVNIEDERRQERYREVERAGLAVQKGDPRTVIDNGMVRTFETAQQANRYIDQRTGEKQAADRAKRAEELRRQTDQEVKETIKKERQMTGGFSVTEIIDRVVRPKK